MKHLIKEWKIFRYNYKQAPLRLKMFIYFCIAVSLFSYLSLFVLPKYIKEAIIPITGWGLGDLYLFPLIVAFGAMFRNRDSIGFSMFYILHFMLFSFILFGAYDFYTYTGEFEGNPYLYHSPWRPFWTMGVPLFWMIVLLSPKVRSYFKFQSLGESERIEKLKNRMEHQATESNS
jgi:hypothetical protein